MPQLNHVAPNLPSPATADNEVRVPSIYPTFCPDSSGRGAWCIDSIFTSPCTNGSRLRLNTPPWRSNFLPHLSCKDGFSTKAERHMNREQPQLLMANFALRRTLITSTSRFYDQNNISNVRANRFSEISSRNPALIPHWPATSKIREAKVCADMAEHLFPRWRMDVSMNHVSIGSYSSHAPSCW